MKKLIGLLALAACGGIEPAGEATDMADLGASHACDTGQIFGTGTHAGKLCAPMASMGIVATVLQDSAATAENDEVGFLAVHYGSTLTRGPQAFTPIKRGYTDFFHKGDQTWSVEEHHWIGATLVAGWKIDSKWKPVDAFNALGTTNGYESLFQPTLTATALYVPGPAGTIYKVNPATGASSVINPFAGTAFDGDDRTIVNSALSADDAGNVFYTVTAWPTDDNVSTPPRGTWLVKVAPSGATAKQRWADIATPEIGVKQAADPTCVYQFFTDDPTGAQRPYPPTPTAHDLGQCGGQRPTTNAAPTITHDGHILLISTDNNSLRTTYIIEVDAATMSPTWAAPMTDLALDACGVLVPYGTGFSDCRIGTTLGFDPLTNTPVAATASGIMEVAPMVAPDDSIYVGFYVGSYDLNQGKLVHLSSHGQFLGTFPYGFESTPTVFAHNGTFSLVSTYNHFSPFTGDGTGPGGDYTVVRLSPSETVQSTFHEPQDSSAVGNDILDGQPAVDTAGNSYDLDASGRVYKISPSGAVLETIDLGVSVEGLAAEPTWGTDGFGRSVLWIAYAGNTWVIGAGGSTSGPVQPRNPPVSTNSKRHRGTIVR